MSTDTKVLISIIIPVYNVEPFLHECLDSVVSQTLCEIEIICINDCSTDKSLAILREYEAKDRRIVVIDKRVNEGLATTRNVGMAAASGKYLLFIDSDDYVDTDLCRRTLNCAEASQADLVIYDYAIFADNDDLERNRRKESSLVGVDPSDKIGLLRLQAYAWTKLIRTEHARLLTLRFPDGLLYEDVPVHWMLVTLTTRVALLPERLCFYRQRRTSIGYRTDRSLLDHIYIYDLIREYLRQCNMYDFYRDYFLCRELSNFCIVYDSIDPSYKQEVLKLVNQRMDSEHWDYIRSKKPLNRKTTRYFYLGIGGSIMAKIRRALWLSARYSYRILRKSIKTL
jgi:glycosyltransferase involved in cell wall biosynthesis